MTREINQYFCVSARPADKVGPRKFRSKATVWRRDKGFEVGEPVLTVYGEGATLNSAMRRACDEGYNQGLHLPPPKD